MNVQQLTEQTMTPEMRDFVAQLRVRYFSQVGEMSRAEYATVALAAEVERLQDWLLELCGTNNHLSTCDREMGDGHACTCGTRRIARALRGLPNE